MADSYNAEKSFDMSDYFEGKLWIYGLHHKKVSVALPYNVRRMLKRCKKNRVRTLYERKAGVCIERPN